MNWIVAKDPEPLAPLGSRERFRYVLHRGPHEQRDVVVEISYSALGSHPDALPSPLGEFVSSRGRALIERHVDRHEPPARFVIKTTDYEVVPRVGDYRTGDVVFAQIDGQWQKVRFDHPGEPAEGQAVPDRSVVGGERRRDVGWVRTPSGEKFAVLYEHLCPTPPN